MAGESAGTPVQLVEGLGVSAQAAAGTMTADFLDPSFIINVEVTNLDTGLPISGATVTSDAGTVFQVNGGVSSVPEPNFIIILAGSLVLIGLRLKCKRFAERTLR